MSAQNTAPAPSPATVLSLSNAVIGEWGTAMNSFFRAVQAEADSRNLTAAETAAALEVGYGDVVADNYLEWADE